MKWKRFLAGGLCLLLCGCGASPAASDVPGDGPYIEIPAQYRAWNEGGANQEHMRTAQGEGGAVAALKYEGAYIGLEILSQGGNAIDAAVAVSFALGVCEPYDSGLGGGGMATYYCAETGQAGFLNFRETTPAAQTSLLDERGLESKALQIGVPGQTAGIYTLWEQYGSMSWDQLLQPAIQLARQGYQVTPSLLGAIELIYGEMADHPELSKIYLRDGLPPQVGDVIQNEPLAQTLETIAQNGPSAFYQNLAQEIEMSVQSAGGYLTADDLLRYQPFSEHPATGTYHGYQIISSPYGGSCLIEALNFLELLPVQPSGSLEQLDQMAQVQQQVFADRARWLGDSRFVPPDWKEMTEKDYAASLLPQWESENTTGFVVADSAGNVVSVTQTLNGHWGSHVYVEGCGFFLNNQLNDFSRDINSVNALEPGKIPLSSMSPTILLDAFGQPALALSAPGGLMIWPALVQVIQNNIDYEMDLDEALNQPRICAGTDFFYYDAELDEALRLGLEELGYTNLSLRQSIARPVGLAWDNKGHVSGSTERNGDVSVFNDGVVLVQ